VDPSSSSTLEDSAEDPRLAFYRLTLPADGS
jgi:hypothetical protein